MNADEKASLFAAVFRNTAKDPEFVGFWVARHQQTENLDEEMLASRLGVAVDKMALVCLCHTPRDESFRQDLKAICSYTGASEEKLAELLRREQVLLGWRRSGTLGQSGWLMAASDRPPDPSGESES